MSDSAIPIPRQAIAVMYGTNDRAEGYAIQPDGSFYVDGAFDALLAGGTYRLTISKGFEYTAQTANIELKPGAHVTREFRMARWVDMASKGWYSADDHIHLRRSPADDPKIAKWIAAEGLDVGNLLQMGDFFATYFSQYAFGDRGRYQDGGRMLVPGQEEPRTPEIGHTISLGAQSFVRNTRDYYSFDRIFDRVHELGGVTGFAHQAMSFHGYRGMVLNTLRGKTDFLELAQFCVPEGPLALEHYYQFLDMGYRLTALAGSDFPWCGVGPQYGGTEPSLAQIGNARFYVYTGGPLTFERYMAGLKAGHTFVTTGPMLLLTVNGKLPGDSIDVAPGTKLHVTAEAMGNVQLDRDRRARQGAGAIGGEEGGDGRDRDTRHLDRGALRRRPPAGGAHHAGVRHGKRRRLSESGDGRARRGDLGRIFEGTGGGAGEPGEQPGRTGAATSRGTGAADCRSAHGDEGAEGAVRRR